MGGNIKKTLNLRILDKIIAKKDKSSVKYFQCCLLIKVKLYY